MAAITPVLPDVDFFHAPVPLLHRLLSDLIAQGERVVPVNYGADIGWLILRYDDVQAAYSNEDELPAAAAYRIHSEPAQGKTLLCMEGAEHRINRLLLSQPFLPRAIRERTESLLLPVANELIDRFGERRELDLVESFTRYYPFRVITGMLGLPVEDERKMVSWVEALFRYPIEQEPALRARQEIADYLAPLIAERRARPREDLISLLATVEEEGQMLDNEAIYAFVRLIFPAGSDTTYLAIGSMMYEVLNNPAVKKRLLAEPALRPWAVEEALRLHGPVALQPRYTDHAVTIAGVDIPPNSWLLYGNVSANNDPAVYDNPEVFDIDRKPTKLLTFGQGPHFCLGAHLARAEMNVALNLLLDRLPGLRLSAADDVGIEGSVLRGARQLPVAFDHLLPAPEHYQIPTLKGGA